MIDNSLPGAARCGGGDGASTAPTSAVCFDINDEDHMRLLWSLAEDYCRHARAGVDPEDLVQEVIVRVLGGRLPVPRISLRGVLFGEVRNVARAMRRASPRHGTRVELAEVDSSVDEGQPRVEAVEECGRVRLVLGERTFEWFRLHEVDGLTFEQISQHAGVSRFTVSNRIRDGIRRLVA